MAANFHTQADWERPVLAMVDNGKVRSGLQKPLTVLFVDDEVLIRLAGSDILTDAGYEVFEAACASEALEILERQPDIQVLVTDIRMPGPLNGLQLAEEVHQRWPVIKLLLTSADTMLASREIPDHGHFLPKPYRGESLAGEVASLLHERSKSGRP